MSEELTTLALRGVGPSSTRLEVAYELVQPIPDGAVARLVDSTHAFGLTCTRGAYPAPGVPPNESRVTTIVVGECRREVVRIDLEATLLNPKAFQVLRNMVSGLRRDGLFVNRMLVTDRKEPGAQEKLLHAANEDNEEEAYPTLSSRVLVPPAWEDSDFKKMRRCLVELLRPPETAEVQKYIDWIKPWYAVLEAGGFSLPIGLPHETDCIRGPPAQFDELTIEIVVDRFFASECAWIVLANMLDGYSRTSIPLSRLIID